ncbi:hypothetical protein [Corynebacterium sp. A21]|uniref:hypothetical protein n=1 Tax=Corynebacterium sp. A21 TaxID=3457318 RepID=UPI003FD15DD0
MNLASSSFQPLIEQSVNQALSTAAVLAASFGLIIPGLPAPAPQPIPAPVNGSCDVSVIARDIGVPEMDTVLYCDGQWARVNQNRTDWLITVRWDGQQWFNPAYDGESWAGMNSGCYTHEHMNQLGGAPEGVHITYCEPGTSKLY